MVERPLRMREVAGSIPAMSILFWLFSTCSFALYVLATVCVFAHYYGDDGERTIDVLWWSELLHNPNVHKSQWRVDGGVLDVYRDGE